MSDDAHPRPALTADTVVFCETRRQRSVLLVERGSEPFAGRWALPGGFVDPEEPPARAAVRELREETGVAVADSALAIVGVYGEPGRDPRGWMVSCAYRLQLASDATLAAGDDAATARWWPVEALPELAFDHARIVADALAAATG